MGHDGTGPSFEHVDIHAERNSENSRCITSYPLRVSDRAWPETQRRIHALLERGLQRGGDFENRWPAQLASLLET